MLAVDPNDEKGLEAAGYSFPSDWLTDDYHYEIGRRVVAAFFKAADTRSLEELEVVFDGPPGPTAGRFIETQDPDSGASVGWGDWLDNGDGTWSLIGHTVGLRREVADG